MSQSRLHVVAAAAIATLAASAAIAQAQPGAPMAAGPSSTAARPLTAGSVAADDRDFVRNAAESGLAQVQGSQLAIQQSQSEAVRRFAQQMVQDHTRANAQLAQIATRKGLPPVTSPGVVELGRLKLLEMAQGGDFDQRYVDDQGIRAHTGTIALFQQEVERGRDPELKRYAEQTLPMLKTHLQLAQQLQAAVSAQNAGSGGTSMGAPAGQQQQPGSVPPRQ